MNRPFGVSLDLADRHPWESVARYLSGVSMTELYHGFAYLCAGEARRGDLAGNSPAVC